MHRLRPLHRFSTSSVACTYRTLRRNHHDLNAAGPLASRLSSRSVIRFSGPDTVKFLQGLLTNDVRKFDEPPLDTEKTANMMTPNVSFAGASPLYAALLTPQGRFLYDFFLYKAPLVEEKLNRTGSGPGSNADGEFQLFADVDSEFLDEIIQTFNRYRLRSKVEINSVGEEFSCWQRYGGKLSNKASAPEEPDASSIGWGTGTDVVAMSSTQGTDQGWRWFKDPRIDLLGYRGIFPSNSEPPLVDADKKTDEGNYMLWRLENGVAEGSLEMPKGEAIPLEYNLEGLNAISFDKGCYVGQELVARTHHRGVIRKRLLPLKFVDDGGKEVNTKVAPGSEVIDGGSGKKVGAVTAAVACRGLGLLRLEDAFKGSANLAIKGQDGVKVEATRPDWWPTEWAQEHQQDTAMA